MKTIPRIIFLRKRYESVNGFRKERSHPWIADLGIFDLIGIVLPVSGLGVNDFLTSTLGHLVGERNINLGPNFFDAKTVLNTLGKTDKFCELMYEYIKPRLLGFFHAWPDGKIGYVQVSEEDMLFVAHSLKKTATTDFRWRSDKADRFSVTLQFSADKEPVFIISSFLEDTGASE